MREMKVTINIKLEFDMNSDEAIASLAQTISDYGTVVESAIALITGLTAQIAAAKDDPAQIQAIIDQANAQKDALAAAVVANTPGADVP